MNGSFLRPFYYLSCFITLVYSAFLSSHFCNSPSLIHPAALSPLQISTKTQARPCRAAKFSDSYFQPPVGRFAISSLELTSCSTALLCHSLAPGPLGHYRVSAPADHFRTSSSAKTPLTTADAMKNFHSSLATPYRRQ